MTTTAHLNYKRALPAGLKLAEATDRALSDIAELADVLTLANSMTRPTDAAADGALPAMLEDGYGATVIQLQVNQSQGGNPGNIANGDTYVGGTSGATAKVVWQDDIGSQCTLWGLVTGTFEVGEIVTGTDNPVTASVVAIVQPGGADLILQGERMFGVEAGQGAAFFAALSAAVADLLTARDKLAALWQGA